MVQKIINVVKDSSGGTRPSLLYMPAGSGPFPLLVFVHGAGEYGTDLSKIYGNSNAGGPAYFIEQNKWPDSFTTNDGKSYSFIVLSPQAPTETSSSGQELDAMIQDMVKKYPVDTTRIYLTGLSNGGLGVFQYTTHEPITPKYPPAAIIPMSMATGVPTNMEVKTTLADNVNVWGFGSDIGASIDIYGIKTHLYIVGSYSGNNGPTPPALGANGRFTSYVGGHTGWGRFYDPSYNEKGVSIYQWLLQFSKTPAVQTPPVTTPPPVVVPPITVPPVVKTVIFSISLTDGKKFTLYADGTYLLA